ncbi:MAG TPA: tetratricopeptide repeat protein [Gemmataceae bacterium]|nr:tetratricopeptide repeat protein [Gemmataceae bacterium]
MTNHAPGDPLARCQEELRLRPNHPEAYYELARALTRRGRRDEAILCYRQALRLDPGFADAHKYLGDALRRRAGTALDEAVACYREAIRLEPGDAEAYCKLAAALGEMGMLDEAMTALRRACHLEPGSAQNHSRLLYCLHYHPDYSAEALNREHGYWNERHAEPLAAPARPFANDPDPGRRLRVGYVCSHFHNHPVGRFLLPLLEAHDRERFEVFCYASVTGIHDTWTARIRAHTDHWRDLVGVACEDQADLIRRDRIDILVDLDAHTGGNRLLTFARKPAPVQVTYLAYCSTTGLRAMDYRLTDPFLDPPGQPLHYAEESVWLETYWCYRPPEVLRPAGPPPAAASGQVTFGCLNNFCKVTPPALAAWRALLHAVPTARLLLHAKPGSHRDRVRGFFAEGGVDPGRVAFVGFGPPAEYFGHYRRIDVGLDPFPYGGGTTTCDALWMGVPVVSLAGGTAVSRAGLSLLSNVGLPELVARGPAEYVRIAAGLAADLPRLAALRAGLRDRMLRSPLTDAPRFARKIEAAFRAMWHRWCGQDAARQGRGRPDTAGGLLATGAPGGRDIRSLAGGPWA